MTAGGSATISLTLALAFAVVPLTWWLLLGWSWSQRHRRATTSWPRCTTSCRSASSSRPVRAGARWSIGRTCWSGFKGRDTGGPFPLFSLLAAIGLAPTGDLRVVRLHRAGAAGLPGLPRDGRPDGAGRRQRRVISTPIGRIGVIWLCGFAPSWRGGWASGTSTSWSGSCRSPPRWRSWPRRPRERRTLALGAASASGVRARTPARRPADRRLRRDLRRAGHAGSMAEPGRSSGAAWIPSAHHDRRLPRGVAGVLGRAGSRPELRRRAAAGHRPSSTYDFVTSTLGDWLTSLPWTRALRGAGPGAVTAPRGELSDRPARGAAGAPAVAPGSRARDRPGHRRRGGDRPEHGPASAVAGLARAAIPPLRSFRVPARAALPLIWALSILSAAALARRDRAESAERRCRRRARLVAGRTERNGAGTTGIGVARLSWRGSASPSGSSSSSRPPRSAT